MKINNKISLIIMIVFAMSCTEKKKEDVVEKIIYFDSQKNIKLYDMKDIMDSTFLIIPLETNNEALIGEIKKLEIRNNRIYVMDQMSQSVYIFDMDGKYLNKKMAIGQGPGEYVNLSYMTVTDSSLIVIDHFMGKQIEYELPSLKLIGEERIFEKIWINEVFYLNGYIYYMNEYNDIGTGKFKLYSRKSNTEDFNKYLPFSEERPLSLGIGGTQYAINGDEISLVYMGNDKIYRLRDGQAYPEYEMRYKDEKVVYNSGKVENVFSDNPSGRVIGIGGINESDKYLFIDISFTGETSLYTCLYNKHDGSTIIYQKSAINSNFSEYMNIKADRIIDNRLICWYDASVIVHLFPPQFLSFTNKEYERRYKNMCENLKDEDNPVLFIYNLK